MTNPTRPPLPVLLRLLAFLRPFAGQVSFSVLLASATLASSIGLLGTSAYLIARAALHPSVADLQVAIVGVRFFGITRGLFRYLERLVSHWVNFSLLARLRGWFYRALEPLAPARLQQRHTGDLLSRAIGDIEILENFYVRAVSPPLAAAVITLGISLFTGRWDARLGLVLAGGLLLAGVGVPVLAYLLGRRPGRELAIARGELSAALVDGIQGLADALVFGQARRQAAQIRAMSRRTGQVQMGLVLAGAAGDALVLLLTNLTLLAVLVIAVPLVVGGELDGVLLAVLALVTLAGFESVAVLPQAGQQLESSLAAARRLFELVDTAPEVSEPADPLPVSPSMRIVIKELTFHYTPTEPPALRNLSLDLPPGKRVAVIGPSGAGKSTLIHLMLRFWDFRQGNIEWDGIDIRRLSSQQARARMALISQSTYLFTATLRQNLLLARPGAGETELFDALRLAGLEDWLSTLPGGLDTWLGEHGAQMSSGERQRLALARALLQDAPLFLLDEPTTHLDALTEQRLLATLENITRGRTLLLVTHRLASLDWFDEILVLDSGCVVERGSHAALLAQGGHYARLYQIQNRDLPG